MAVDRSVPKSTRAGRIARRFNTPAGRCVLVGLLTLIVMLRIVLFAFRFGGMEQDSGWYLGVAKNLAYRGIYAANVNLFPEEGKPICRNIHKRLGVQDRDGRMYFSAAVTVGPGYVVPQAIILRLFGDGWWQYRLWPLATYAGMTALLLWLALRMEGLAAVMVFFAWLWLVPMLSIPIAYEAISEPAAMLFLLVSLVCYSRTGWTPQRQMPRYLFAGLALSLAALTKVLTLLVAPVFALAALAELRIHRVPFRDWTARWTIFALALVVPYAAFSIYRYVFLAFWMGESEIRLSLGPILAGLGAGIAVFAAAQWYRTRKTRLPIRVLSEPLNRMWTGALLALAAAPAAFVLGLWMTDSVHIDGRFVEAVNYEHRRIFISCGSGISQAYAVLTAVKEAILEHRSASQVLWAGVLAFHPSFVARKATLWSDLGLGPPVPSWATVLPWLALLLAPLAFRRAGRAGMIFWLLFGQAVVSGVWFLLFSETGWMRHAYFGLLPQMVILSCLPGLLWRICPGGILGWSLSAGAGLAVLAGLNWPVLSAKPLLDADDAYRHFQRIENRNGPGLPFATVYPLEDQNEMAAFLKKHLKPADRVYFSGWYLVADIGALADRVFFPLQRYRNLGGVNPDGGASYLIHGPYQRGRLSITHRLPDEEIEFRREVVFEKPSYALYRLP